MCCMDHDSLPGIEKGFALLQKLILYRTAIIDVHIEISTFIGIFSEVPQRLKKRAQNFHIGLLLLVQVIF